MKLLCIDPSLFIFTYLVLSLIPSTNLVSSQEIERVPESYGMDSSVLKRSARISQEDVYRMFVLLNKIKDRGGIKRIGSEFIGKRYSQAEDIEKKLGSEFLGKRGIGSEFLGKRSQRSQAEN
uniref:Uncharacterized protein n=1 Tax=Strigamia maritima TaxID=126957 RepID=T1IT34_STRMM